MLRRGEDPAGIVDADDVVGRRVEDQQRAAQLRDRPVERLAGEVVDEAPADAEAAAADLDIGGV
jgi:hypothetical protein